MEKPWIKLAHKSLILIGTETVDKRSTRLVLLYFVRNSVDCELPNVTSFYWNIDCCAASGVRMYSFFAVTYVFQTVNWLSFLNIQNKIFIYTIYMSNLKSFRQKTEFSEQMEVCLEVSIGLLFLFSQEYGAGGQFHLHSFLIRNWYWRSERAINKHFRSKVLFYVCKCILILFVYV